MTMRPPMPGEGIYLDETERRYWVVRNDIGAHLLVDENGEPVVISASHPALSNKELRVLAAVDRLSK
jgi:hypothetical protein